MKMVTWKERFLFAWIALAFMLLAMPRTAFAQNKIAQIAEKLQYPPPAGKADDFRVRIAAALELGKSGDDAAVAPLCAGLGDPNETVRLAVTAGLTRLSSPDSASCIKARIATEPSANVKQQLVALAQSFSGPKTVANATVYVAIAIQNKTSRPKAEIERVVLKSLGPKLESMSVQMAPTQETPQEAQAVIKKRKLKGYYLSVIVEPFEYSGDSLKGKLNVAVSTYPGKDLKASFAPSGGVGGVSSPSKSMEDTLLDGLASNVGQKFADNFK